VPTFSADYLARLGGTTGFRSDTLEKVLRLGRVLDQVGRHPFLGERLALKGGTALNLFFGAQAPRLSVDLDFNYVRPVERDEMLREKEEIERALGLVAEGDGYRLQWGASEHAGRKTYLGYRNALGTPDRIEVDVNYLYRVSLQPVLVQEGWTPDPDFPSAALGWSGSRRPSPASSWRSSTAALPGICTTRWDSPRTAGHMIVRDCAACSWS
jgi:hypothetical protein